MNQMNCNSLLCTWRDTPNMLGNKAFYLLKCTLGKPCFRFITCKISMYNNLICLLFTFPKSFFSFLSLAKRTRCLIQYPEITRCKKSMWVKEKKRRKGVSVIKKKINHSLPGYYWILSKSKLGTKLPSQSTRND